MIALYINWDFDPEIANIYGFPLKYYGLLFAVGLLLCAYILKGIFKNENLKHNANEALFIYGIIGIFIGARLVHCFFYDFDYYSKNLLEIILPVQKNPDGIYVFTGYAGLASHGGTIGLIISLYLYSKRYSIKYIKTLDLVAIVAPLGATFIRLANFMNSEMIGTPTSVPWAFIFKCIDHIPRHPAQLYEAISYLAIFGFIFYLYKIKRNKFQNGFFFGMAILLIFMARFFIEFIKERQVPFEEQMQLDIGQLLSIPFVAVGLVFIIYGLVKTKNNEPGTLHII